MAKTGYHHKDLRRALIDAGIELVLAEGAGALTLRRLGALCGVSQAAPYAHFSNKEELLAAMQDHVTQALMAALTAAVEPFAAGDPMALIALGRAYVTFFLDHPAYFTFLFANTDIVIDLNPDAPDEANYPPFALLRRIALPALPQLGVPANKAWSSVIALWSTVHGLAAIVTMKNTRFDGDWADRIEEIIWREAPAR